MCSRPGFALQSGGHEEARTRPGHGHRQVMAAFCGHEKLTPLLMGHPHSRDTLRASTHGVGEGGTHTNRAPWLARGGIPPRGLERIAVLLARGPHHAGGWGTLGIVAVAFGVLQVLGLDLLFGGIGWSWCPRWCPEGRHQRGGTAAACGGMCACVVC